MTPVRKNRRAGSTVVEFALVGIPVIFLIISIFEIARGMWVYQTLSHATHSVARHIAVRGAGCGAPNTCSQTLGSFATDFATVASGMDPAKMVVTFYSQTTSIACNPLNTCNGNATVWPPAGDNIAGSDIRIAAAIPFPNALSMFWPGSGAVSFSAIRFTAYSRQRILF
jgi:Flp pilus assembly protein TadG